MEDDLAISLRLGLENHYRAIIVTGGEADIPHCMYKVIPFDALSTFCSIGGEHACEDLVGPGCHDDLGTLL